MSVTATSRRSGSSRPRRSTTFRTSPFLAIQEDLLLRLLDIIESGGTALAFPSQTMYFTRDAGVDRDKSGEAVDAVRAWRERGEVPFPDFSPERKASMRGAIEYPPRDSALRNGVVGP